MGKWILRLLVAVPVITVTADAFANGPCCLPDGSCVSVPLQRDCFALGGTPGQGGLTCDEWDCGGGVCGDGIVDPGEDCDDGNTDDTDDCRNDCTLPNCGDGIVDPGEECDDGNDVDDDDCRNDCTAPVCGDGIVDPGEDCDDGNMDDMDDCRNDCTAPVCGDGIVDPGEACDDGNMDDEDDCRNDCTIPECGDGILDPGEECDDGNRMDGDGCSADCTVEDMQGGEGCTPGYWKQRHHFGNWAVYLPEDNFDSVFGVDAFGETTLLGALRTGGGHEYALGRHAVAALLNSVNPDVDYYFTSDEVIAYVQMAFDTGEYNAIKNMFAEQNEAGCPLGRPKR